MANLPLNEPAGVLVKTTLVDYPGMTAGSFFLKGCNLRCPYCYNIGLVVPQYYDKELNTLEELFSHLEKRQGILSGLVISGGEPLINTATPAIIKKAKELGYKVKLDTNGTFPSRLKEFIENPELKPDFIAMDIKTSPYRYPQTMCIKNSVTDKYFFRSILKESADLISTYPADKREWRTVLVPGLVEKQDIKEMAELLPQDASWQFAQFRNGNCIDSSYNNLAPYLDSEINELITYAKSLIKNVQLR
ncbi:MAG: anaerobic ribonucleoside-triphosphate reductase activating protein [Treponema sp.]|nr:anaerobic ribonucleoside-triphosphate reductase activating protein [Treponema sp.]